MTLSKLERRNKIKVRIRSKILGTAERPRMTVYRSNKQISVQLINDKEGKTLVSASSLEKEIASQKVTKTEQAALVGKAIAEKARTAGIEAVIFDRNARQALNFNTLWQ